MSEIEDPQVDTPEVDTPDVEPEAPAYDWGDYKDEPWAARFKDPSALAQSVEAGTQKITQQAQELADYKARLAEYEANQPPDEPWRPFGGTAAAPANVDPGFYGRVEQEYLRNPEGTFRELIQGGDEYAQYTALVYEALEGQIGKYQTQQLYQRIVQEQQQAEIQAMLDERVNEAFASVKPMSQHVAMSMADAGVIQARAAAPDFDDYMARIIEAENTLKQQSNDEQSYFADVRDDPTKMAARLVQLRDLFWSSDQREAAVKAAAAPAPAPAKATARRGVIGQNNASRPEDSDREQQLRDSMRNTKVRDTI